jgi:peptidoglycan-associated lipoprotein
MTRHLHSLWLGGIAVACASNPPPAGRTFIETTPAQAGLGFELPPPDEATASNIAISAEIKSACGLSDVEGFFAFDSAKIREQDRAIFRKISDCFTTGPLKGREMRLVGHADSRGDEEYNHVLGQRRADNVRSAVVEAGMSAASVWTSSRGEDDASGSDEQGWAKDRRVDIVLGG